MVKKSQKKQHKMPTQRRSRQTVDDILAAATHVLGKEGFARATTNRIAERAGVGVASIYQYFADKSSIVSTLITRRAESTLQMLEEALLADADDSAEALAMDLANRLVLSLENAKGTLVQLILMAPLLGQLDHIRQLRQRGTDLIAKELRRRRPHLDEPQALQLAFVVLHSVMGVVHGYLYSNTANLDGHELTAVIQNIITTHLRE